MKNINKEIREAQLEIIFQHPSYLKSVAELVADIREFSEVTPNEKTLETRFELKLFELFEQFFAHLGYRYYPNKEVACEIGFSVKKGRADTSIGSMIIEFKQPKALVSEIDKNKAIQQAVSYIQGFNNGEYSKKSIGFITDGEICAVYTIDALGVENIETFSPLSFYHIDRMVKSIIGLAQKTFDADVLVSDFASPIDSPIKSLSQSLYTALQNNITPKTRMLLAEWMHLFKLSHDDTSQQKAIDDRRISLEVYFDQKLITVENEYKALFSLQTAYSILIKVIAFKAISQVKPDQSFIDYSDLINADDSVLQLKMEELESGSIIRDYGVQNLLEGDFFSWYASKAQWDSSIALTIRNIIVKLDRYTIHNFFQTEFMARDFFKNLYQSIIPKEVRHSLGEYYTPYWLAQNTVDSIINENDIKSTRWRGLDPTCGSGTFITVLINRLIHSLPEDMDKSDVLREVTSRVVGIDLNPLAVLTARVNYFLNIAKFISFDVEVEIPIYAGDAAYTPSREVIEDISFIKYSLDTEISPFPIYFPEVALGNLKKFSRTMIDIELDILSLNESAVFNRLIQLVPSELRSIGIIETKIKELSDKFVEFESKQWNGIWARIIANYLTTSKIGEFDVIVGNPPWVDWKNLPSQYREKIKSLDITKTIFSGDSFTGGINLNIAALITNVVITNWLSPTGILGMLMPDTFLVQKTYEGYRDLVLGDGTRAYFFSIDDWSKSGNPFVGVTQKFYTYYIRRLESDYKEGIPIAHFIKKRGTDSQQEVLSIKNTFDIEIGKAIQLGEKTTSFAILNNNTNLSSSVLRKIAINPSRYKGREGVEFYPQELLLFSVRSDLRSSDECVTVENIQVNRSKFKVPLTLRFLEKKFLHPLIRGVDIRPFAAESQYVVPFAYESSYDTKIAIPEMDLREKAPLTYKFFHISKSIFESQNKYSKKLINGKNIPFYSLARVGEYSFAPFFVAYRDNTRSVASVLSRVKTPWGEYKMPVFQNHAVIISQRPNGDYISEEEAHYIAGIINSTVIDEFVKASSDGRSFPINHRYQIPLFGSKESIYVYQQNIARLSQAAHKNYEDESYIELIRREISDIYLEMLKKLVIEEV